jgi:NAD(P)-dependent dehydrogenase (short-subunit alcohol dehydrogenase family)
MACPSPGRSARTSKPGDPATDLGSTRTLVTGATRGLGRAMASALTLAGAHVAVASCDAGRVAAVAAELGPRAFGLPLDVRDEASVRAGVDRAYERFGRLDLLVVNAGIGMRTVNPRFMTDPQPFWKVSPDGFRDVIETKITGSFLTARKVAPRMLSAGAGRSSPSR